MTNQIDHSKTHFFLKIKDTVLRMCGRKMAGARSHTHDRSAIAVVCVLLLVLGMAIGGSVRPYAGSKFRWQMITGCDCRILVDSKASSMSMIAIR